MSQLDDLIRNSYTSGIFQCPKCNKHSVKCTDVHKNDTSETFTMTCFSCRHAYAFTLDYHPFDEPITDILDLDTWEES
jgi:transcription elongation factor Elf1